MKKKYVNIHEKLIEKCKKGNTKAQFEIYKLYFSSLYNTCYRIVNDNFQAEDLMQETFLTAFDKIEQYEGNVSFGAWLKKIVINKSIDYMRKNKIVFENIENDISDNQISEDIDCDIDEKNKQEIIEKLKFLVLKLPDKYRIIFSLYFFEGFDHDEIAEIQNITASTSRSQLSRAKKKILEMMKNN